jgi:SusD family.
MYLRYYTSKLFLLFTALFCLLVSCKKHLNLTPQASLSDADFWKSANDMALACNYFYTYLPGIDNNTAANWSDDGFSNSGGPNVISNGSRQAPTTSGDWSGPYKLIFNCNHLLEKAVDVPDDETLVNRYRAEARFFRAWAYYELVKKFGDVPLILRTFDVNDTLTQAHRTHKETVLDTAYADIEFAVHHLPTAAELPVAEYGRITKGAALALKARIGLFAGTRNKFHGEGNAEKHLNACIDACTAIMQDGAYGLFTYDKNVDSSYYYLFQYAGEGNANKENILVRLYGENMDNSIVSHNYPANLGSGNGTTPTRALMDAYLYQDGLPADKSPYYKEQENSLTEFEHRDPRMGMTVFNKNVWYLTSLDQPTFTFAATGYKSRKYFIIDDFINKKSFIDNIVIRYAEVLLMYAEAKYELEGSISDEDLNRSINLIRARVNMPNLTNDFVTNHQLDMREEIRRERRIELAFEGEHRYWDLIRWKIAETELPKAIRGSKYFPQEQTGINNPNLDANGFVIVEAASKRNFNPERDYLWALPVQDIGLDKNLYQNPNW